MFGSLAVIFAKPRSQKETVNDLHGDVVNLARVIADAERGEQLYDGLQRTLFSEAVLEKARTHLEGDPPDPPAMPLWHRRLQNVVTLRRDAFRIGSLRSSIRLRVK